MNRCEFCGLQEADHWVQIQTSKRLFCSNEHGKMFESVLKTIKFKAGWSTIEMLIAKEINTGWNAKAFRGMIELEFDVSFDEEQNIVNFNPIFNNK